MPGADGLLKGAKAEEAGSSARLQTAAPALPAPLPWGPPALHPSPLRPLANLTSLNSPESESLKMLRMLQVIHKHLGGGPDTASAAGEGPGVGLLEGLCASSENFGMNFLND